MTEDKSNPVSTRTAASEPTAVHNLTTLERARKFLEDGGVQAASREDKIKFLLGKGLSESQVVELLDGETSSSLDKNTVIAKQDASSSDSEAKQEYPPVVTYPEFLTTPAKPPPLMTASTFLNALYAFGGLSTVIYGISRFGLTPMVESLSAARSELYDTAARNLLRLTEQLEAAVSEIPPSKRIALQVVDDDNSSSCDDPTEMFHRDIGVQTSPPTSPVLPSFGISPGPLGRPASLEQATRISDLAATMKYLNGEDSAQDSYNIQFRDLLDDLKSEVEGLSRQAQIHAGGYPTFGTPARNEPDDEIRRAKENIRRVKGVLLSARSFPASAR